MITIESQETGIQTAFEKEYLRVRKAENRLYSDEQVLNLPAIDAGHPHAEEWKVRSRNAQKLIQYLAAKKQPLLLLDIGCGNGWLSNQFAAIPNSRVTAIDINGFELDQARRLFVRSNLRFEWADAATGISGETHYDVIVFAASIQYFPDVVNILKACLEKLNRGGEIHITDTRFYKQDHVMEARERTRLYYQTLDMPQMIRNYFHHTVEELSSFKHDYLFNPHSLMSRLAGTSRGFPWIRIRKKIL